jgi:putative PIN family toxin of toxin-antitoxin system
VQKLRAVIDTNVLVSGIISPKGAPRKILELARREIFQTVTSVSINREVLNVLHREYIYTKYNLNEDIIDNITAFLYEQIHLKYQKSKKTLKITSLLDVPLKGMRIILLREMNIS